MNIEKNLEITKAIRNLMKKHGAHTVYTNKYTTMRSVKTFQTKRFNEVAFIEELASLMTSLNVNTNNYEVRRRHETLCRPSFIVRVKYAA